MAPGVAGFPLTSQKEAQETQRRLTGPKRETSMTVATRMDSDEREDYRGLVLGSEASSQYIKVTITDRSFSLWLLGDHSFQMIEGTTQQYWH